MTACTCNPESQCDTCAAIEDKFEEILHTCQDAGEGETCHYDHVIRSCDEEQCPILNEWLDSQAALAEGADPMTVAKDKIC